MTANTNKKLIEVSLPLDEINTESLRRKQKAPKGWPTSFHKWWAQRPIAAARAVIFSQLVDDPSSQTDLFATPQAQDAERERLFAIIRELVQWDNTHDKRVLEAAKAEIHKSWARTCSNSAAGALVGNYLDPSRLPDFCDPFTGSGSLPLSAQWLGLTSHAIDINPVAVLINKALIEIPRRFAGFPPVNPDARRAKQQMGQKWSLAQGLAEDVRYFGRWMKDEARRRIGHLYPDVEVGAKELRDRPDLRQYSGVKLEVIAWIWARTVKSPNPAFSSVDVPLASTFMLSSKAGKVAYVEPEVVAGGYTFRVRVGSPSDEGATKRGTKSGGSHSPFLCLMSGTPMPFEYLRAESRAGRMGSRLMAVVAEGDRGRVFLSPTSEMEDLARSATPDWRPEVDISHWPGRTNTVEYGMTQFADLFTRRQLVGLNAFCDLVAESTDIVKAEAIRSGMPDDEISIELGGRGALAYAQAISTYLACVVDRMVYYGSSLTSWLPKDNALRDCMPRQALAMTWDYAECNPLSKSSGDVLTCCGSVANYLDVATPFADAFATQGEAQSLAEGSNLYIFSTDPPYYDNISYADLSDFFYVWLRRSLRPVYPKLFETVAVPKAAELVASPYRHGSRDLAETFFMEGMTIAMRRLAERAHPAFPITIYYAFKQSETDEEDGTTNTGWDTFLEAVLKAGFSVTGTWPLRTEGAGRMIASGSNALASSIVLVCRPRSKDARVVSRREFVVTMKQELLDALGHLQHANIAPVDLAQAAIGPGMAVFSRFAGVLDAEDREISVREALSLINQALDESLAEQEGDFDADSRFAITWFDQMGFAEGEFGQANVLAQAKNTGMDGLVEAGIIRSARGKVRLLKPDELPAHWDPTQDARLTAWETVHQLVRALESGGEGAAAALVAKLGTKAEAARELAYRLYSLCERRKRAAEALSYNALVQSWPQIVELAKQAVPAQPDLTQADLI